MGTPILKPTIIIAGPGAGKTHNMVEKIIKALPELSPCRYMAVITYTNAATANIRNRLAKRINIPENVFIGTIHAFLNRFVILPFSSMSGNNIGKEKLFIQLGIDDVFNHVENNKPKNERANTNEAKAILKSKITNRLNERGYITFDQTLSIAKKCFEHKQICKILANRLQYLFVDEFQDADNQVFSIIENLRKLHKTIIYCVGDPEQYIQSFDSTIRLFRHIPILKAAASNMYNIEINPSNYRCNGNIISFLNHFNGRTFQNNKFQQLPASKNEEEKQEGEPVCFITAHTHVTDMLEIFNKKSELLNIQHNNRSIIAKKKDLVERIAAAVNNNYKNPSKTTNARPVKIIQEALLTSLNLKATEFLEKYQTDNHGLRKKTLKIFNAVNSKEITDSNSYGKFVTEVLGLEIKNALPIKIQDLQFQNKSLSGDSTVTVSTIHTIKGLESQAVLAIAKNEAELLLWIETDMSIREAKRTSETTDYPRLGYVAFSRAEKLLCIACLQKISDATILKLTALGVSII